MTLDPLDFVYDSEYAAILGATGEVQYLRAAALDESDKPSETPPRKAPVPEV